MPLIFTVNNELLAQFESDISGYLHQLRQAQTRKEREQALWGVLDNAAQSLDGPAFASVGAKPDGERMPVGDEEVTVSAITVDGDHFGHWYPIEETANLFAGGYTPGTVAQMLADNLNAASLRLIRAFT